VRYRAYPGHERRFERACKKLLDLSRSPALGSLAPRNNPLVKGVKTSGKGFVSSCDHLTTPPRCPKPSLTLTPAASA
jgi:hypothetical protein